MNPHRVLAFSVLLSACGEPDQHHHARLEQGCEGASCPTITWSNGPALPQKRDHHITFIGPTRDGATLYVAGGATSTAGGGMTIIRGITGAEVRADGSLGAWTDRGEMPEHLSAQVVAVSGRHVVMAGGVGAGPDGRAAVLDRSYVSTFDDDGALGEWLAGPPLPIGVFHGGAEVIGESVYVVGGASEMASPPVPSAQVVRAVVAEDGTLGVWEEMAPLPEPRSHHALVAHDGALWVLGGITGEVAHADVLRALVDASGDVGAWEVVSTLPLPLATHSAFVREGAVYVVGGIDTDEVLSTIHRASFAGASLGAWEEVHNPLPVPRSHVHQTPVWGRCIYSVAGGDHTSIVVHYISNVFVGCF